MRTWRCEICGYRGGTRGVAAHFISGFHAIGNPACHAENQGRGITIGWVASALDSGSTGAPE